MKRRPDCPLLSPVLVVDNAAPEPDDSDDDDMLPGWGPWARDLSPDERRAEFRGLAVAVHIFGGPSVREIVAALLVAEHDPSAAFAAYQALRAMPTYRARRAISVIAALSTLAREVSGGPDAA